eukprot:TRINITY_DN9687_c0_g1_i1.p1 TRINITY_DN9687_c0_g1~~TRINITY_DN9687_c0_g1_i1.p1  ORF type:complete len:944 (+),score=148.58 TRINITY_DN9687_c0_g1_i1:26-2833(+)
MEAAYSGRHFPSIPAPRPPVVPASAQTWGPAARLPRTYDSSHPPRPNTLRRLVPVPSAAPPVSAPALGAYSGTRSIPQLQRPSSAVDTTLFAAVQEGLLSTTETPPEGDSMSLANPLGGRSETSPTKREEALRTAQRMQVQQWMQSFQNEAQQFQSLSVCAELLFAKVVKATESLPQPNLLRVATCFLLFDRITELFGRYRPLLNSLLHELFGAIYVPHQAVRAGAPVPPEAPPDDPSRYLRRTYFDEFHDFQSLFKAYEFKAKNYEAQLQKQVRILNRAIIHWQRSFLSRVLQSWRDYLRRAQYLRRKYARMFQFRRQQNSLSGAFNRWVEYTHQCRVDRSDATRREAERKQEEWKSLAQSLTSDVRALRAELEIEQRKSAALQKQVQDLQGQLAQAKEASRKQNLSLYEATDLLHQATNFIIGHSGEAAAKNRPELQAFVALNKFQVGVGQLGEWVNRLLSLHAGRPVKVDNTPEEFRGGQHYLTMLHVLAPEQVSKVRLRHSLSQLDPASRADSVVELARGLGLPHLHLRAEDIMDARNPLAHNLFLAALFHRWCNTFAFVAAGAPPLVENGPAVHHSDLTLIQHKQRLLDAMSQARHWQRASIAISSAAVQFAMEEADARSRNGMPDSTAWSALLQEGLSDLLPPVPIDADQVVGGVQKVLFRHFPLLSQTHSYYSQTDGLSRPGMPAQGYWRWITDSKITDKRLLPRQFLDTIFDVVSAKREAVSLEERELTLIEFAECIVRIARVKHAADFPLEPGAGNTAAGSNLASCLDRFLTEMPAPGSRPVDDFLREVYRPPVQQQLRRHHEALVRAWKRFTNTPGDEVGHTEELGVTDFGQLLRDYRILSSDLGSGFTLQQAKQVYSGVQEDYELRMLFHEFQEALVAISMWRMPNPFQSLETKVQQLLSYFLTPPDGPVTKSFRKVESARKSR